MGAELAGKQAPGAWARLLSLIVFSAQAFIAGLLPGLEGLLHGLDDLRILFGEISGLSRIGDEVVEFEGFSIVLADEFPAIVGERDLTPGSEGDGAGSFLHLSLDERKKADSIVGTGLISGKGVAQDFEDGREVVAG